MSGLLSAGASALSALQDLLGSRARLLPASFRGVPFVAAAGAGSGGRRIVTHEFPLRDEPYTEDLGRLPRHFTLRGFVIDTPEGDTYLDQRDALIDAVEGYATAGVLVHPTHGPISVRAGLLGWSERWLEAFGYCEFELQFTRDGEQPSPVLDDSTASRLLSGVASILPLARAAYSTVALGLVSPRSLLLDVTTAMLGLPPGTIQGLSNAIAAVAATPNDAPATATAMEAATQGMAAAVIAGAATADPSADPLAGQAFAPPASADPSGGLADLARWGDALPAIAGDTAVARAQAAMQARVIALAQGQATAALAQVYASIDWPSADAATAARATLLDRLDAQAQRAADAGDDDLYRAWRAMTQLAMADMIARAQALPSLGWYAAGAPLPSLALAQFLYVDPSRAAALEDLNGAAHPLFMPPAGRALALAGSAVGSAPPSAPAAAIVLPDYLTLDGAALTGDGELLALR